MPSSSRQQQKLMCLALSIKLGKVKASKSPQAAKMARQMSVKQLSDFCHSPIEGYYGQLYGQLLYETDYQSPSSTE